MLGLKLNHVSKRGHRKTAEGNTRMKVNYCLCLDNREIVASFQTLLQRMWWNFHRELNFLWCLTSEVPQLSSFCSNLSMWVSYNLRNKMMQFDKFCWSLNPNSAVMNRYTSTEGHIWDDFYIMPDDTDGGGHAEHIHLLFSSPHLLNWLSERIMTRITQCISSMEKGSTMVPGENGVLFVKCDNRQIKTNKQIFYMLRDIMKIYVIYINAIKNNEKLCLLCQTYKPTVV